MRQTSKTLIILGTAIILVSSSQAFAEHNQTVVAGFGLGSHNFDDR